MACDCKIQIYIGSSNSWAYMVLGIKGVGKYNIYTNLRFTSGARTPCGVSMETLLLSSPDT